MTNESVVKRLPYEIESVKGVAAPFGEGGADWHRYVITQGSNTINGYRQGNLDAVTWAVEEIVAKLNERRSGSRGRVHLVISSKNKPQE